MTTESTAAAPASRGPALVVEDNPIIALDTQAMLEELGFSPVETLGNLTGGLETLAARLFSFVILDFRLGDETSLEFARQLLARGTNFAFASGYSDLETLRDQFQGRAVLSKPYTKEQIGALI
ncbi:response regulator [Roseibium sp. M-1]